jgi:hypothetical protein
MSSVGRMITSVVVAVGAILSVTAEAASQQTAPPRQCAVAVGNNQVVITAGPDESGQPAAPFPELVTCPGFTGFSGDCLRWRYRYESMNGSNLSLSMVTVDSDVEIRGATGPNETTAAGVSIGDPGDGASEFRIAVNVHDVRVVKFSNESSAVGVGNVFTSTNVGVGSVTAGSKQGNRQGFCRIAGADNVLSFGVGQIAITTQVIDDLGGVCAIIRTLDEKGCTLGIQLAEGCPVGTTIAAETLSLNGGEQVGVSCSTQITFFGSTRYCYPSSTGQMICVTF